MARRQIQRVPASLPTGEFARFLASETPVILEGVAIDPDFAARLEQRDLLDRIESREGGEQGRAAHRHSNVWLDVTPSGAREDTVMSGLYDELHRFVPTDGVSLRDTHVRLWEAPRGTLTPWHYDGNGIHGLNLQVLGRKYWQLVSPETPLPSYPFVNASPQGAQPLNARQRDELDWLEFETGPGDVLFLPRLWSHYVLSIGAWNANMNLVFTPLSLAGSALARREYGRVAALAALQRSRIARLLPARIRSSGDALGYGGAEDYFRSKVPRAELVKTALNELRLVPLASVIVHYRRTLGIV
jgi:hypothetical protein